jgi:hypothetical protein
MHENESEFEEVTGFAASISIESLSMVSVMSAS